MDPKQCPSDHSLPHTRAHCMRLRVCAFARAVGRAGAQLEPLPAMTEPTLVQGCPFPPELNIRDIATGCAGVLQPGRVVRCSAAALDAGQPAEVHAALLGAVGVRSVVDLRTEHELARTKDPTDSPVVRGLAARGGCRIAISMINEKRTGAVLFRVSCSSPARTPSVSIASGVPR